MKKLIKSLIPTLSVASIAAVTSCSCTMTTSDVGMDRKYFEIDGTILKDFKEEYKRKESIEKGDKLTIFKDITALAATAFCYGDVEYDSMQLFKKIDYEEGCVCTTFSEAAFNGCQNLETVIFPPKFNEFGAALFQGCSKLTRLDISNIENEVTIEDWYAPATESWSDTGKIIYDGSKPNQVRLALKLLDLINFEPAWGEQNHWTLETK